MLALIAGFAADVIFVVSTLFWPYYVVSFRESLSFPEFLSNILRISP